MYFIFDIHICAYPYEQPYPPSLATAARLQRHSHRHEPPPPNASTAIAPALSRARIARRAEHKNESCRILTRSTTLHSYPLRVRSATRARALGAPHGGYRLANGPDSRSGRESNLLPFPARRPARRLVGIAVRGAGATSPR